MNERLVAYSAAALQIVDDMIEYSQRFPNEYIQHTPVTMMELSYVAMMILDDDGKESDDELIKSLANSFEILPIYYHIQVLRQLVNRYYGEILDRPETIDQNILTLDLRDTLMAATELLAKELKSIPSPMETFYLYMDNMTDDQNEATDKERVQFKQMIDNKDVQKRVLLDYLDSYEHKYGKDLHQEVLQIGK
ncbi:hypothetical protein FOD75_11030 (plasmid) [Limosilactobacillus reuteri]|uniref:Uncharacterized protein n=1 Tax=Limosilactobacillus reuteri TaxID=1598 RepID=A0A517D8D8_LIMRT|nr:hypothetical protein [Limosilactobacillus reuteri]QDR73622.1 hypothetical protein FOD75_11030 [Limosilactobacillus reuteri]